MQIYKLSTNPPNFLTIFKKNIFLRWDDVTRPFNLIEIKPCLHPDEGSFSSTAGDPHRRIQDRFELYNLIEIVDGVQSRRCRHELFLRLNTISSAGFLPIASGFNLNEIITWKNRPAYPTTIGGKKKIRQPKSADFQQYGQNRISIVKVFFIRGNYQHRQYIGMLVFWFLLLLS